MALLRGEDFAGYCLCKDREVRELLLGDPGDLGPACAALVGALQSPDAIEADIDGGANYFVVQLGGKPIGYFAWKMEPTALHLLHLYLLPAYRGKALGRDILASCERLARSDGKGRVRAEVHTKALPVLAFFKERGYRPGAPEPAEAEGIRMDLTPVEKFL